MHSRDESGHPKGKANASQPAGHARAHSMDDLALSSLVKEFQSRVLRHFDEAALVIQRVWRRKSAMLLLKQMKKGVLQMQKNSRGHIKRAEMKLRAKSAVVMQRRLRVFVAQSVFERQRTAITKVQFRARMAVAKKRIRRQQRSAVRIQAFVRGSSARTRAGDEKKQEQAIVGIQAMFRGMTSRRLTEPPAPAPVGALDPALRAMFEQGATSARLVVKSEWPSGIQTSLPAPRPALPAAGSLFAEDTRPQRPPRPMTRLLSAPAANESRVFGDAPPTAPDADRAPSRGSRERAVLQTCLNEPPPSANPSRRNPPGQSRPTETEAAAAIQASMRGKIAREQIRARPDAGHAKSPRHKGQGHAAAGLRRRDHAAMHPASPRKANAVQKSPRDGGSANSPAHRGSPQEHGKQHRVKSRGHSDTATVAIQSAWRGKKGREAAAIESEFGLVLP